MTSTKQRAMKTQGLKYWSQLTPRQKDLTQAAVLSFYTRKKGLEAAAALWQRFDKEMTGQIFFRHEGTFYPLNIASL